MLVVDDLGKNWPDGTIALHNVSFVAHPGQIVAIIGPSGAGKTTLLRTIAGLESYDKGRLELAIGAVGLVFQQPSLWPHLTLLENVALPLYTNKGLSLSQAREKAYRALSDWGLGQRLDAYPAALSGGQQQRGAVVRTMMLEPEVLCLDEITSALDPEITSELLGQIVELKETGTIVLLNTHQLAFARKSSDWVLFFEHGQVVEQGPPEQLFVTPQEARTQDFIEKANSLYSGFTTP